MPKSNEISYFRECFTPENQGLRSYFGNVVKGQPKVYDTPFARGESTQELLSKWMEVLESIKTDWPTLWDFENDLAKKVGPMSVELPLEDRMQDIESYYDGILLPSKPVSSKAVAAVKAEWSKCNGLHVRKQDRTVDMMRKSTNSGSPFFTRKRLVVNETVPCFVYNNNSSVYQRLNGTMYKACAVLGWRGQEGGPEESDVKQRIVWMFPFSVNIRELQVYQPVIEAAQYFNLVPAWVSMDAVDRRVTDLFDSKDSKDLVVCTDFSKFDQHFNSSLQEVAHALLQNILTRDEESDKWLDEVFPIKYMIPLTYNWETVRFGRHGMGSGSGGTNCDETLAHRALQYEAAQNRGALLNLNSQCLGDDGMLTYPGITVEDVVDAYSSHGLEMNLDKQYASSDDCTYLRRWHHKDYRKDGICVGVYSTCRALGRLRYLERYMDPEIWDEKAVALRQLSILENVKYHPLKEEFVSFCMKRDKYRLGIDIPNFLSNIESIAKEKTNLMPEFLGYTKTQMKSYKGQVSGIANWWIVQYLKELA